MVPMVLVILVLIVLVAAGIVAAVLHRPSGDDIHSVQSYNNALGTLEHLSERIGPPTRPAVRPVVLPGGDVGDEPVRLPVPPVRVRGSDEFPDPDEPLVFDDARPTGRTIPVPAEGPTTPPRVGRQQRVALGSLGHRRSPGPVPIIIGTVIVLFVVLAVIGSHHPSSTGTTTSAAGGASSSTRPPPTTRPTPTTLPTKYVPTTAATDGTSATYTVAKASYQLTLNGTGTCWVQVTSASSGSTVWAGALEAGSVQNVDATGTVTVQFGTPQVTLSVDDIPLVLPTPLRTPFVATIQPSSGGTTTSTSSTTTTTATGETTTTAAGSAASTTTTVAAGA